MLRLLRGEFDAARATLLQCPQSSAERGLWGSLAFLQTDYDAAIDLFQQGLTLLKKETGKRKVFYAGFTGVFCVLSLLVREQGSDLFEAQGYLTLAQKQAVPFLPAPLETILRIQQNQPSSCINSVVWWPKRASIKGFNEF